MNNSCMRHLKLSSLLFKILMVVGVAAGEKGVGADQKMDKLVKELQFQQKVLENMPFDFF